VLVKKEIEFHTAVLDSSTAVLWILEDIIEMELKM